MTNTTTEQDLARDHQRFNKLLGYLVKALILSLVIGLIGGYAVYQILPAGKIPVIVLYLPGIFTALIAGLFIRNRKMTWFPTEESLKAASEYKPTLTE